MSRPTRNAGKELFAHVKDSNIAWASLSIGKYRPSRDMVPIKVVLRANYDSEQFDAFRKAMDFDYDNGYGSQEIDGQVMLCDGTWLERREYDGSEWWAHCYPPSIPDECKPVEE